MPFHVPPVTDERDALGAFLAQQQDAFRCVVHGLDDAALGATPTPSSMSLGALVKHVTQVQQHWLSTAESAPARPVDGRPAEQRYAEHQAAWTWLPDDTAAAALAALDETSAKVLAAVAELDLETSVPVPEAPWFPKDVAAWSVRWVWLHLIEELARHAGHADLLREAVDGATMYALVAARDGVEETPWLKPWRPQAPAPAV